MANEDRANEIARAVNPLIKPGEAWVVRKSEESTNAMAFPQGTSSLTATNPELYGRLLKVSEQLSEAGGALCIWGPIVVVVCCLGLHLDWFQGVLGEAANKFRSLWLYIVAFIISVFLFGGLARAWERVKYGQYRDEIMRVLDDAKIPPHRLIALIEGDEALDDLADQLKTDPRIV